MECENQLQLQLQLQIPGTRSVWQLNIVWWHLICVWILSTDLASFYLSVTQNFEVASRFLKIYALLPQEVWRTFHPCCLLK
jgi:hypothetical protein